MNDKIYANKIISTGFIVTIIIILNICLFLTPQKLFGQELIDAYKTDLAYSRYWQGLDKALWEDWQSCYMKNILYINTSLYLKYTGKASFSQIENKLISTRPLIVWFAFKDGTTSTPEVVISSGSKKYDNFWCEVITKTSVISFPEDKQRIFMWEGDIMDVVDYLKSKNVLPEDYELEKWITPTDVHWEKI